MGFLDFIRPKREFGKGYKEFSPSENVWYHYSPYDNSKSYDLKKLNLPKQTGYVHPVECWEIRPFAFIKGKKHRAKFKIIGGKCIIEVNKKRREYPLNECSFAYKFKYFHHKRIDPKKRKYEDRNIRMTPSGYGEYYVSVLIRDSSQSKESVL